MQKNGLAEFWRTTSRSGRPWADIWIENSVVFWALNYNVTKLGDLLKGFGPKFSYKIAQIFRDFEGYFVKLHFLNKPVVDTFWQHMRKNWATFYYNIWSHLWPYIVVMEGTCSFKGLANLVVHFLLPTKELFGRVCCSQFQFLFEISFSFYLTR